MVWLIINDFTKTKLQFWASLAYWPKITWKNAHFLAKLGTKSIFWYNIKKTETPGFHPPGRVPWPLKSGFPGFGLSRLAALSTTHTEGSPYCNLIGLTHRIVLIGELNLFQFFFMNYPLDDYHLFPNLWIFVFISKIQSSNQDCKVQRFIKRNIILIFFSFHHVHSNTSLFCVYLASLSFLCNNLPCYKQIPSSIYTEWRNGISQELRTGRALKLKFDLFPLVLQSPQLSNNGLLIVLPKNISAASNATTTHFFLQRPKGHLYSI